MIWINGAFGAGKTSVTKELLRRVPGSRAFDPEQTGFMLRRMIPAEDRPANFQDMRLWRELTVAALAGLVRDFAGPWIVPMTLVHPEYFNEMMTGLTEAGVEVRHFTLVASSAVLRRRLLTRWSTPGSMRWTLGQVERCVEGLGDARFVGRVETEGRTVEEVARDILSRLREG